MFTSKSSIETRELDRPRNYEKVANDDKVKEIERYKFRNSQQGANWKPAR